MKKKRLALLLALLVAGAATVDFANGGLASGPFDPDVRIVDKQISVLAGHRGLIDDNFCDPGETVLGGGYFVGGPAPDVAKWTASGSYPRFAPPISSWGWVADGWNNGSNTVFLTSRALCASFGPGP